MTDVDEKRARTDAANAARTAKSLRKRVNELIASLNAVDDATLVHLVRFAYDEFAHRQDADAAGTPRLTFMQRAAEFARNANSSDVGDDDETGSVPHWALEEEYGASTNNENAETSDEFVNENV
jgi:hypothetical protein